MLTIITAEIMDHLITIIIWIVVGIPWLFTIDQVPFWDLVDCFGDEGILAIFFYLICLFICLLVNNLILNIVLGLSFSVYYVFLQAIVSEWVNGSF